MEQHAFLFRLIIEGATEKVLQLIMQLKSICNKNHNFNKQKMDFWTLQRGSNKKKCINRHFFYEKKNSNELLRAALYKLILVLHKDVLFHLTLLAWKVL